MNVESDDRPEATVEPEPAGLDERPAPSWRRLLGEGFVATVGYHVLAFLWFAAARTPGHTFFQDVLINGLAPDRTANAEWWREGVLPTWSRSQFGGGPWTANIQRAFYYPGNLPFAFLNPSMALKAIVVTSVALACVAMWAYCRIALRTSFWAAALAGLAYGFSGFALQHVVLTNQLQVIAWTPLVMLFGHLALERGRLRYVVGTAVMIGLQFLAGHPEEWVYTVGLLASYGVVWSLGAGLRAWPGRALRGGLRLGGAVVLFVLLFGWQLLPTLQLRGQGFRTAPSFREQYPLPKAVGASALLPDYGRALVGENVGFIGVAALLLAVLGLVTLRRGLGWWRAWAVLLAVGGWVMAFGHQTFVYRLAYNLSIVRGFRVPSRYLLIPTFVLAAACAPGLDALLRTAGRRLGRDRLVQGARWLGAVAVGSAFVLLVGDLAQEEVSWRKWALAAVVTGLCWLVAVVRRVPRTAIALALLATTALELYYARPQAEFRQVAPNAVYDLGSPLIKRMADEGGRYVTIADTPRTPEQRAALPVPAGLSAHDRNYFVAGYQFTAIARPNVELYERAETVLGRDGGLLPIRPWNEFFAAASGAPGAPYRGIYLSPPSVWNWTTLDFLAVRWFVTPDLPPREQQVLRDRGFEPVDRLAYVTLWRRPEPPLLRLVSEVDVVPDAADRVTRIKVGYPLLERALVERPLDLTPGATGNVTDVRIGLKDVSARVTASAPALVVLADPWYPEWRVYVNGKPADLLRVNHAFRGVRVPAGTHQVEFRYEDSRLRLGVVLTVATVLFLLLWTLFSPRLLRTVRAGRGRHAAGHARAQDGQGRAGPVDDGPEPTGDEGDHPPG